MSDGDKTLASAHLRIDSHEELCALRYAGIMLILRWICGGLGGLFLALLAWMAVQLYSLEPLRAAIYTQSTTATISHTQAGR